MNIFDGTRRVSYHGIVTTVCLTLCISFSFLHRRTFSDFRLSVNQGASDARVRDQSSYKFNLKNTRVSMLNYAFAGGIFRQKLIFPCHSRFHYSSARPPPTYPSPPSHPSFLNFEIPRKFLCRWKATYWRSFFRNDRHWPSFPVLPVHEIPTSRDESSPDLTTCLSSCNYFGSIAQNFPLPTWFKLNVNSLYATLTSNFSIGVSVSPLPFRSILLFSVWSREIRLTVAINRQPLLLFVDFRTAFLHRKSASSFRFRWRYICWLQRI